MRCLLDARDGGSLAKESKGIETKLPILMKKTLFFCLEAHKQSRRSREYVESSFLNVNLVCTHG